MSKAYTWLGPLLSKKQLAPGGTGRLQPESCVFVVIVVVVF